MAALENEYPRVAMVSVEFPRNFGLCSVPQAPLPLHETETSLAKTPNHETLRQFPQNHEDGAVSSVRAL